MQIHGRPVKAGGSFSAAHILGFFDNIEAMHTLYAKHKGYTRLTADPSGWRLER